MKLIVLGAAGILGRALMKELAPDHQAVARDPIIGSYDLRDRDAFVRDLEAERPAAVINSAAYTQVDQAEGEPELTMAVNGEAPGPLAAACAERELVFVQISSDYVFDGEKGSPYREDDPPHPRGVYARSKRRGEETVIAAAPSRHLIVRTSGIFGQGGRNFILAMAGKWREGVREFRVVADQRTRVTYAPDLARAVRLLLEKNRRGIYHAANAGDVSWHELAREIFQTMGVAEGISLAAVTAAEFKARAPRPRYSVLDTQKLERDAGYFMPRHEEALARYLREEGFI
jgi:dTDP-4-dehydrorhamnose reductase